MLRHELRLNCLYFWVGKNGFVLALIVCLREPLITRYLGLVLFVLFGVWKKLVWHFNDKCYILFTHSSNFAQTNQNLHFLQILLKKLRKSWKYLCLKSISPFEYSTYANRESLQITTGVIHLDKSITDLMSAY